MALPPSARRTIAAVTAALIAGAPLMAPAYAGRSGHHDPLKHRQHAVHHHIGTVRVNLDDASAALRRAQARLASARAQLAAAEHRLVATRAQLKQAAAVDRQMQARLAQAQRALIQAQAAVAQGREQVANQRTEIGVLVAQNYEYGNPQLMGLVAVLGSGTPTDVTSQLNTVHSLMSREAAYLDNLKDAEVQLSARETQVSAARDGVAQQQAAAAATLRRTQQLEHEASAQRAQVAQLVASRHRAEQSASRTRAHDARQLVSLQRQERRIKREILARARHQRSRWVGSTSGILEAPVNGPITSPFGYRLNPIYHYWGLHDGDDFGVNCGTPAHAAGTGTIISEYYSPVWGNRLYLDLGNINGHNFTVIYNHLTSYRYHTGAHVGRGTVVAYTGTTGWSTGCHLHFTVMRDGVAVNPMSYIG